MPHHEGEDRLKGEGVKDELQGTVKEGWGKLTGDESDEAAGKAEQTWGQAQQGAAGVVDELKDAADAARGRDR
ncbi:MAG TPA: CsbD family protein [Ardenticatenaceae bacterium]|nr:CsbD family protein [Ardenticatenaceae bacterium]